MAAIYKNYLPVVWCAFFWLTSRSAAWEAHFEPSSIVVEMSKVQTINLTLSGLNNEVDLIQKNAKLTIVSDSDVLAVSSKIDLDDIKDGVWNGEFNVTGLFLGVTKMFANISYEGKTELSEQFLDVTILREERLIDRVFTACIVALVSILYINFGAALDLGKVKEILVRPIGPLIAFVCQFLFMPLVSRISLWSFQVSCLY